MSYRLLLVTLFLIISLPLPAEIPQKPQPARFVNDYAGILDSQSVRALENKLSQFDKQSSTQIVIVTVKTLEGIPLEDYSIRLAESWGIGQKKKDNGVLILMAQAERKVRIEVGYGLEGVITDLAAKRIIDGYLIPYFKKGDFYMAFSMATDQLMALARGEFQADEMREVNTNDDDLLVGRILAYVFLGFVLLMTFFMALKNGKTALSGGITILAVLGTWLWTEYEYWPNFQNGWYWLRMILLPIGIIATGWIFTIRYILQATRFQRLQKMIAKAYWQELHRLYASREIDSKRQEFVKSAAKLSSDQSRAVKALLDQITQVYKSPEKHFQRRNEADLIELEEKLQAAEVFEQPFLDQPTLDKFEQQLYSDIDYYKKYSLNSLDDAQKKRLQDSVATFQLILEDPAAMIGLDDELVRKTVTEWMQSIDSKFSKYKGSYTSASISKTKKSFQKQYKQAQESDTATRDLYTFYTKKIQALLSRPWSFLTRKPSRSYSSGSYSSGSSYSSSSFSSSSFSSSSSSSFGGGSFGGGGSSGSW